MRIRRRRRKSNRYLLIIIVVFILLTIYLGRRKLGSRDLTWEIDKIGVGLMGNGPLNSLKLKVAGKKTLLPAGLYAGNCFEVSGSFFKLLPNEIAGIVCWSGGGGNEIGVFKEKGKFFLKYDQISESSGSRDNFTTLAEIR